MLRSVVLSALLVMSGTATVALAQSDHIPSGFRLDTSATLEALAAGMAGLSPVRAKTGVTAAADSDAEGSYWYRMAMKLGRNPRFRHKIARAINARGGYLDRKINAILLRKEWETSDVPRLDTVAPGLLRGGQPTEKGFARLKGLGVTMVVNLRLEDDEEEPLVRKLGMTPVWLPMPDTASPTADQVAKLHELISRPGEKVYVHCSAGIFRTGTMVASWRIKQGLTFDAAFADMKQHGFDPEWLMADTEVAFLQAYAASLAPGAGAAR